MFLGLIALALLTGVQFAEDPATQLPGRAARLRQKTVIAQIADGVFGGLPARLLLRLSHARR